MLKPQRPIINPLNTLLIVATIALLFLVANKYLVFGSQAGKWVYSYLNDLTLQPFLLFLILCPFIIIALYLTNKYIGEYEIAIILGWLTVGFITQVLLRTLYPFSFEQIIISNKANSFYSPTTKYNFFQLLINYNSILPTLPLHAKTNMPGKILLFYFLRLFTSSPQIMGYLIMLVSNIGAIFTYYICKYIFNNKLAAAYALILYLFFPAKMFFLPILNTVSPVFMLLSLFLMLRYLSTYKNMYLLLLGASLYILFIFEPLPLMSCIIFLAILTKYHLQGKITIRQWNKLLFYPILSFIIMHFSFSSFLHYNAIKNFIYIFGDAVNFNARSNRPYDIWVVQNLKNLFVTAGLCQSIIFFLLLFRYIYEIFRYIMGKAKQYKNVREFILQPGRLITFAVATLILTLNLSGINRGEIVRLWIFAMVFLQFIASNFCATKDNKTTFYIVVLANLMQTAVGLSMVRFVNP